jgi:putative flavoprotein involved in K+ transport
MEKHYKPTIMATLEIDTLIIGGGQAGLATSFYLTRQRHKHLVIERLERAAGMWRNRCWDSFTLVTPNWAFRMPGVENNGVERDGFKPRHKVIEFFEDYIATFGLPVSFKTEVLSVTKTEDGMYQSQTTAGDYRSRNIVMATGFYQQPKVPGFSNNLSPEIRQLHSSYYRNPKSLPEGAVLVVGSGQSGCQIAEELLRAGRKVYLSTGSAGRAPRRYRGKDIIEWLEIAGFFNLTPDQLPPGMGKFDGIPHLSGKDGGHTINLHKFAQEGITLLGHVRDAKHNTIVVAPDLYDNLKIVDAFERDATEMIDGYIEAQGLDAPAEALQELRNGYAQIIITELDLKKEGVSTIIWATGYTFDYNILKLPVLDQDGFPIQTSGVTKYPGLYFAGIPWMPSERTGFLLGVAESARHIASQIAGPVSVEEPSRYFTI